ncbi:1-acyl-sn-glycerol-3-phosphate acyltransferase [Fulvitalea axinellae]|uniref:1-acyl-sn-glycerol-3-phosphate acyltransferase n=1 Tax=Fulvitalea axinellae TaxID=1182444 RepID=A0AAU9DDQ0_9BACT|nr:1-acyl-sn-glycerol-3-phosphate acyltransferase [Fulvitalea axinellae]
MWKLIANLIFKVAGWKVEGDLPKDIDKAVMIAAPHTSNWDFVFARAAFFLMGVPVRFTIKKEWVEGPLGWLIKSLGAIAIDRSPKKAGEKRRSMVEAMTDLFAEREELVVMITPEGTRSYAPRWKKGFYYVALNAKVPIVLGYLDYGKKKAGVGPIIHPTGDYEKDLEEIKSFYRQVQGRHPDKGIR